MIQEFLLDMLPAVLLILHFLDKWYLSKGRLWPVYVLATSSSICSIGFTYLLYSSLGDNHKSVLLFSVNAVWTFIMAIKGMARLAKSRSKDVQSSSL